MNYNINVNKSITLSMSNGDVHDIQKSDPRFDLIFGTLGDKDDEKRITALLENDDKDNIEDVIISAKFPDFVDKDGKLTYKGFLIEGSLKATLLAMIKQGFNDIDRYKAFIDLLIQNPNAASVRELFDFMSYDQLPINEKGYLIAYKGVKDDFYSVQGNTSTVVETGTVDSQGRIFNGIGETISVARNQVDGDRNRGCSNGLHVGSRDYADSWASKLLLVEVNPADVVSVPEDCSCQKMRVSKYKVLQESKSKVECVSVDTETGSAPVEDQKTGSDRTNERVQNYVNNRHDEGISPTIKQIQGSLKGSGETCLTISQRLVALGIPFKQGDALSKSVVPVPASKRNSKSFDDGWDI